MKQVKFCTREQGLEILAERNRNRTAFDVLSYAPYPFRMLSPFFYWRELGLNLKLIVPEQSMYAYSVESIWQGSKIIDGKTNFDMFKSRPYKRPSKHESEFSKVKGFLLGNEIITDYVEARKKIFVPAYTQMYNKFRYNPLINSANLAIHANLLNNIEVFLYDVDDNPNIEDISKPYSHAALLVDLITQIKTRFIYH